MTCDTSNFFHELTQSRFGQVKLGQMLVSLNQLIPVTTKLLNINIDRYRMVSLVDTAIPNSPDFALVYQTVCDIFPAFPFVVSGQLLSQANHAVMGEQLQIAGIGSSLAQYDNTQRSHIIYFLRNIDLSVNLLKSSSDIGSAQAFSYLPKLVKGDLILIAKNLQWQPSQKSLEMIEHYYSMRGLTQIFLRYYFDLIAAAETDEIAQHIDDIFLNFFISLHYRELQYWESYSNANKIKNQLKHMIEQNDPAKRHPVLNKPFFDQINDFHPIVHDEGPRKLTSAVKSLLDEQLKVFFSFSMKKMALFLRVLTNTKEPSYTRYLLLQIVKTNPNQLFQFKDFLQSSPEGSSHFPELLPVLDPILNQIVLSRTLFQKNAIFQKIENAGVFSDFDLLSEKTRNRITQTFQGMVSSLNSIQQKEASLKVEEIHFYLKIKKITSTMEMEIYTPLIQSLNSTLEEEQTKLMNNLRQVKITEINKEVFEKVSVFVSSISKQPSDLKERLLKSFDREIHRIIEVLGKEKLIPPSKGTLEVLGKILHSTTEEKLPLLNLSSLIFSLPVITRPATIDHFLRMINKPEMIDPQLGKRERDLQLRSAVDRSLHDKRIHSKIKEIRSKQQGAASPADRKTARRTQAEKNALQSELIKLRTSSDDFVNKYLFPNVWIAEIIKMAENFYHGQFLIAYQLNEILQAYQGKTVIYSELKEEQQKVLEEIHQRRGLGFKGLVELFNTMGTKDPYRFVSAQVKEANSITNALLILGLQMTRYEDQFGLHVEFKPFSVKRPKP